MPERKQQLRRVPEKKPNYVVKYPNESHFKKFASTRDSFYSAYKQNHQILQPIFEELELGNAKLISINSNPRIPAIRIVVDNIPNLRGFVKLVYVPGIGQVIFVVVRQNDKDQKSIQKHEDTHAISDGYFDLRKINFGNLEHITIPDFELYLFNEIISTIKERKPDWLPPMMDIEPYMEFAAKRDKLTDHQKEAESERLVNEYINLIRTINYAKKEMPKIIIMRILRASTFQNAAENLRKAMKEGRYV